MNTILCCAVMLLAAPTIDQRPGQPGEWGFRPGDNESAAMTPPAFCWRPQQNAAAYTLEVASDESFATPAYRADSIQFNVHCPPRTLPAGVWWWRFRYADDQGALSPWSRPRKFEIPSDAVAMPLPTRGELLGRIAQQHPRLFVRPEDLPRLRQLAQTELKGLYDDLVRQCDSLLKSPPPSDEPPTYPQGMERLSEQWREIWWGNREYTIRVLNGAATLGFTHLLDGNQQYGQLARRLLMAAAQWDPHGATGYRYNDEAGMPYAYYFSRTYTFIHHLLSEAERAQCRAVMKARGDEMYLHLCPRHLWQPYASHSNRAWHFLGEVGIAFHDEIEGADDWTWFAMNVFANVYPVWCDPDGGWHEGLSYWRSYIYRFTWFADVMRSAFQIDAYRKPYFSQAGYFPLYLQPPGTRAGGFGDLAFDSDSEANVRLMQILAAQSGNPHWQWYVQAHGSPPQETGYVGFVRGALPEVKAEPPNDLPTSRAFHGVGVAALNSNLLSGRENISVLFKSSPFGLQSHGFEGQNAFQLYAYGQPLLIRTGRRDVHGSSHHTQWMWSTRSVNSVLVNGEGQQKHSPASVGEIRRFFASPAIDYVEGEAAQAYGRALDRFSRGVLFVKPDLVVIFDRLEAPRPSSFQWLLHAPVEMQVADQHHITVASGGAACRVNLLRPAGLSLSQTDQFDPPPRERIRLRQFHLTADAAEPVRQRQFVAAIRPYRADTTPPAPVELEEISGGYALRAKLADGEAMVLLQTTPGATLAVDDFRSSAEVAAVRYDRDHKLIQSFSTAGQQP